MYQFVNAILLEKGKNKTFREIDISMQLLNTVFTSYLDGYVVLNDTSNPSVLMYLDYKQLKNLSIKYYNMVFETWLLTLTVGSLPTTLIEPVITRKNVLYSDAIQAQFTLNRSGDDAIMHKDNIDTHSLHHRVLTSVNGFLHRNIPDVDGESLRILSGNMLRPKPQHNMVGIYSFNEIGDITQIPITIDMLHDVNTATKRSQSIVIKTNIDATNKTVLLSIVGYLHALDSTYEVINENPCTIVLKTNRISYPNRLFELSSMLTLDKLGLSTSFYAPDAIATKELGEDTFINTLLTMVQSFVIIVDAPRMYTQKQLAIKPPHIGWYESLEEPVFPLYSSTGRELTYWRRKQVDRWIANIQLERQPNYIIHTTENELDRAINQSLSEEGYGIINAYFLGIYSQTMT